MATSKHFSDAELRCKHCGKNEMDEEFLEYLEKVREELGVPLFVTSGYRCPEHNIAVSNSGAHGPHTTGKAVDIMISGKRAYKLVNVALGLGFTGIGVAQKGNFGGRFIHLDMLEGDLRPRIWSY